MSRSLFRSLVLATTLAILLGACGLSSAVAPTPTTVAQSQQTIPPAASGTGTPSTLDLSGKWAGTWKDTSPDTATGDFTLTWTQSGHTLAGTIAINGSRCISAATLNGAITGNTISFGVVKGQETVSFTGTIGAGNTSLSGSYQAGPSCGNAKGVWTATKQ